MLSLIRLACSTLLISLCCAVHAQPPAASAVLEKAQQARTLTEALSILGISKTEPGRKVLLEVPDIALAGQAFAVKVQSQMPGTDWIAIFSERSAPALIKLEEFPPGTDRVLSAQINLAHTGRVRAVVRSGGKYYEVSREVKMATPGGAR